LDLDSESYFGLDAVGTGMWDALTTSPTMAEAYSALLQAYEVEPQQLREDLLRFVDELSQAGLVDVAGV
jgi:hypothetical protein